MGQLHSFLNPDISWRWVAVSFTLRSLYAEEISPCAHWTESWMGPLGPRGGLSVLEKSFTSAGIDPQTSLPTAQSLYLQSYRDSHCRCQTNRKTKHAHTHQRRDAILRSTRLTHAVFSLVPWRPRFEHSLYFYHPLPPSHPLYLPCCVQWFSSPLVSYQPGSHYWFSLIFLSSSRLVTLRPAARQMQLEAIEALNAVVTCFVTMWYTHISVCCSLWWGGTATISHWHVQYGGSMFFWNNGAKLYGVTSLQDERSTVSFFKLIRKKLYKHCITCSD